jgi:hypothetical protein
MSTEPADSDMGGAPLSGDPAKYAGDVPHGPTDPAGYDEANDGTPFNDGEVGPGWGGWEAP